jgi:protein-tyrosine phosphatase/membrane-associated phospholipid phosphatase
MEPAPRRPWKRAAAWLAFLGPFFFASYGFANWVASRRADVGSLVYDWERTIPFAPWTIVPYWSIDAFYAVSVFVCATARELDTHARRLVAAQVGAVACFLLFPLTFTFPRPETDGLFGTMFDVLMGFDKPFNQAPSLHMALLVILWVLYARHVPRAWRWLLHAWFALIGVSILTTYQHHFVDLPTGAWLGWLCVWLFPDEGRSPLAHARFTSDPARRAIALRYGLGAAACAVLAWGIGGWAHWLFWVSGSLLLVAVIYAFLDEGAFQKRADGSMTAASRWLMGPYFAAAWINSRWWTRKVPAHGEVVPGLRLGRIPTRADCESNGYRGVVDLTAELSCETGVPRYSVVPQLDLTVASPEHLERAVAAIEAARAQGPTLVCCALGFSRSALAVAAWLVASGRARSAAEALEAVRRARPHVVLGPAHVEVLERFAREREAEPA